MGRVLQNMNIGDLLLASPKAIYAETTAEVKLDDCPESEKFEINNGVKQGCPLSCVIFLMIRMWIEIHSRCASHSK